MSLCFAETYPSKRRIAQTKEKGESSKLVINLAKFKMADKLRPDELQAFKAAFDMFDKNGDGTISTKVRI